MPGRDAGDRRRRSIAARLERLRERDATERGYDRLVVYADREHSANLAYLTGFDPRFEEAILVVGPAGEPAILVGNECYGHGRRRAAADAAPPVPGPEPAEPAARPLAAARRDPRRGGHRRGQPGRGRRLEGVRRPRDDRRARRTSSTSCAALAGPERHRRERDGPPDRRRPTVCGSSTRSSSSPRSSTRPARPRTASGSCCSACGPG